MADNRRQVELALQVTTANTDAIGKLRESVKALAKEGAQIAPAFEEADAALAQLGEQVKQLQTIEKLAPKLAEVSQKQQELKEKSKQLATEMKVLTTTTAAAQDELDRRTGSVIHFAEAFIYIAANFKNHISKILYRISHRSFAFSVPAALPLFSVCTASGAGHRLPMLFPARGNLSKEPTILVFGVNVDAV